MHLLAFIVVYRKHHIVSLNLKLASAYINSVFLSHVSMCFISLHHHQFHLNATERARSRAKKCIFQRSLHEIHRSICCIYSGRTSQRIAHACSNLRGTQQAHDPSRQARRKQTSTNAYGILHLGRLGAATTSSRGDARISARARSPSPWLESRRRALLSCRRDEIRYFVKVISPRKVSFRQVIASAPFPPTAAALHATQAREAIEEDEKEKVHEEGPSRRQPKVHGEGPSRRQASWYCRKRLRTSGIAGGESRAEVKDRSVTLIEGKLFYRWFPSKPSLDYFPTSFLK